MEEEPKDTEKFIYYAAAVGALLVIGTVYYFIWGKKEVEAAILKEKEENAENARLADCAGYVLCPDEDPKAKLPPTIIFSGESGAVRGKITAVTPKVHYTDFPKTNEEMVNARRDFVIEMIVADGGGPF